MINLGAKRESKLNLFKKPEDNKKEMTESQRKANRAKKEIDNQKEASRTYAPKQPRIIEKGKVWDEKKDSARGNGQTDV